MPNVVRHTMKPSEQMNNFTKIIDRQIEFNQGKNIFLDNLDIFQFSNETVKFVLSLNSLDTASKQLLIDYSTDKAIEEFCRINQYYSFDSKTKQKLKEIYRILVENIETKSDSIEKISKIHYERLKQFLIESNPFAKKVYENSDHQINPITCSQYAPELQINILKIDIANITQPVLDIGCGKESILVNYLKSKDIVAVGIDRFTFSSSHLITTDWLEYTYGVKQWGTIISNLGFSNHFRHHNLRLDGNYIEYAKTYMNILRSLKVGGRFHYAPDLPFIEKYLNNNQFAINKYDIDSLDYKTTVIERLT